MRIRLNNNLKVKKEPGKKYSDYHLLMAGVYSDNNPGGIPEALIKEVKMERPTVTVLDGLNPQSFLDSRGPQDEPTGTVNTVDSWEGDIKLAKALQEKPEENKPEKTPSPKKSSKRRRRSA